VVGPLPPSPPLGCHHIRMAAERVRQRGARILYRLGNSAEARACRNLEPAWLSGQGLYFLFRPPQKNKRSRSSAGSGRSLEASERLPSPAGVPCLTGKAGFARHVEGADPCLRGECVPAQRRRRPRRNPASLRPLSHQPPETPGMKVDGLSNPTEACPGSRGLAHRRQCRWR